MDHEILVRPFFLGRQAPAFLVADLDLGRFGLAGYCVTDRFRCMRVALFRIRMLPIYTFTIGIVDVIRVRVCADIAVTVTARVAFRDLPVGLLDLVPGADDQVAHLDSVTGRNLGDRAVDRRRKCSCPLVIFTKVLKLIKCTDAERYKFLVCFIPFAILGIRSRTFDIVSIHVCRVEVLLLRELIAQIQSEIKLGFELCRILIGKEISFRIVKHLLDRQCAHDLRRHLVRVLYSRAPLRCIVSDAEIRPRRPVICRSFCGQDLLSALRIPSISIIVRLSEDLIPALIAVYVDMVIYRSVHTAFDEFVPVCILGEVDHCRIACFEKEYILICDPSYLHGFLERDQFFGPLIYRIYLSGQIRVLRRLFQKDRIVILLYDAVAILAKRVCAVLILFVFNGLIPDLIRVLDQLVRSIVRAFELFGQFYRAGLYGSQVETHPQVGRARAALHVEHLHLMRGVIVEHMDRFAVHYFGHEELVNFGNVQPARRVILPEDFIERSRGAVADHFTRPEVHRAANGAVDTAQIQHKLAVDVEPEVVVAGKLEDDVVSPVVHAVRRLGKHGGKFHAKIVISLILRDRIQRLALARV